MFTAAIFLVGIVGNVLVVVVIWRTRSLHTPTNCYLSSLAVADILLLITAPLPTIVELFFVIDQTFLGKEGCCLMVFTQYLGVNVSALSITFFTIERYIAICHPMKAQTMCTIWRAKRIIAGLWVFGLVYCGPWLGLVTTLTRTYVDGTTIQQCSFALKRSHYLTYYMADLVIFYVAPLLLTCVLYGRIACILYSSTRPVGHAGQGKAPQHNGVQATGGATGGSTGARPATASSRVQVGCYSYTCYVTTGARPATASSRVQVGCYSYTCYVTMGARPATCVNKCDTCGKVSLNVTLKLSEESWNK